MHTKCKFTVTFEVEIGEGWDPKASIEQIRNDAVRAASNRVREIMPTAYLHAKITPGDVTLVVEQKPA